MKKSVTDQIKDLENTRAAKQARMEEIAQKATDEGRSMDEAESEEFDTLDTEVKAVDKDLVRFRKLEEIQKQKAKPAEGQTEEEGRESRSPQITVRQPKAEKGLALAQVVKCLGRAQGNRYEALKMAEQLGGALDQRVKNVLKAAVAAGTTSNSTWAGALVGDETSVFADFIEFLRPQTIVGRFGTGGIPSLRRVPFRTPLIGQTSGGNGYWVGEGKGKPLTKFDFSRTTLEPLKVANIAVVTEETLRSSSPSADGIIRDQLVAALRERLDIDFIDPDKAVSSGVSPASVTNGISAITSTGNTAEDVRNDIKALFGAFIAGNNAPTSGVWIMPATTALALSLMQNPLGQSEFPGISMNGGTLFGLPVIVSEYVPTVTAGATVVLLNASDIYLGDEGGFMVDVSREASLQMDDSPTIDSTNGTGASLVSLWQTNSVGFRAEREISWARRRADAVAVLDQVNWGASAS